MEMHAGEGFYHHHHHRHHHHHYPTLSPTPVFPPCAVDGRSRNPPYHHHHHHHHHHHPHPHQLCSEAADTDLSEGFHADGIDKGHGRAVDDQVPEGPRVLGNGTPCLPFALAGGIPVGRLAHWFQLHHHGLVNDQIRSALRVGESEVSLRSLDLDVHLFLCPQDVTIIKVDALSQMLLFCT